MCVCLMSSDILLQKAMLEPSPNSLASHVCVSNVFLLGTPVSFLQCVPVKSAIKGLWIRRLQTLVSQGTLNMSLFMQGLCNHPRARNWVQCERCGRWFSLCLPKCDTEESKRCWLLLLLTPYDVWLSAHASPIIEGVTLPNNGLVVVPVDVFAWFVRLCL